MTPAGDVWADAPSLSLLLREALVRSAAPVIYHGDRTLPAASLWVGARTTVRQLRDAGVPPGARLRLRGPDPIGLVVLATAALSGGFHLELARPGDGEDVPKIAVELHGREAPAGTPRVTVAGLDGLQVPDRPDVPGPGLTAAGAHLSSPELGWELLSRLRRLAGPGGADANGVRPLGVHRCPTPRTLPALVDDLLLPLVAAEFLVFSS